LSLLRYLISSATSELISKVVRPDIHAEYRYLPVAP
jgi:hypothetical protein